MLSGYTYKPGRTFGENVKRKIFRIGIAYFFYSGVLLLLSFSVKLVLGEGLTRSYVQNAVVGIFYSAGSLYYPREVTPNVDFLIIQNGPLWFLTCFMAASLIFCAVEKCLKSRIGCVAVFFGGVGMTVLLSFLPVRLPWSLDTSFAGTSFMVFGYFLRREEVFEKCSKWYLGIAVLLLYIGLCKCNPGIAMSNREYGPYGIWSILLFFVVGMSGALSYIVFGKLLARIPYMKDGLLFVGRRTMTLLAFHVFIFLCVDTLLEKAGVSAENGALHAGVGVFKILLAIGICSMGSFLWARFRQRIQARRTK